VKYISATPTASMIKTKPVIDDLTIVIPTLGRDVLKDCLYWIAEGSAWPDVLIVVDQGSNPEVIDWIDELSSLGINTQYISSKERGRSAGINRGLECVRTRFVAITDDDCLVDDHWLEYLAQRLGQSPEVIFTGRVELAGNDEVEFSVVKSQTYKIYHHPQLKVHPLIGANMGVAMTSVARIGLFDEHPSLSSAEDSDWGYRALRLGIPIVYDPEILVHHFHWRDQSQRAARYREYCRSQGGFYGKYLFSGDVLIVLQATRDLVRGPIRWLRGLIVKDQDMIDRGRADTLELLPGIIAGFKGRDKV
jgi:GT2 family glycosyltransferase